MCRGAALVFALPILTASHVCRAPVTPEGRCPVPTAVSEWGGPAREARDLDAARYERRYGAKFQAVHESWWQITPGVVRYLGFGFPTAKSSLGFFSRWKTLAHRDQIVLREGRCVVVVQLSDPRFLPGAADKVQAQERYGPGMAFQTLDLPPTVFPSRGRFLPNPFETFPERFEDQLGGISLLAVRRFMWQGGPNVWAEAIFLVPAHGEEMQELLEASLRFRRKANGHVVDFVAPEFLIEVLGATPQLVDETAAKIQKLHADWKRQGSDKSP